MNDFGDFQEALDREVNRIPEPVLPTGGEYAWISTKKFVLVETLDDLKSLVDACIKAGLASLDLETTGLDNQENPKDPGRTNDKIVGYCISHDGETGYYIPVLHQDQDGNPLHNIQAMTSEVEAEIRRLCEGCTLIYHHARFDHEFLRGIGYDYEKGDNFEDTLILDYLRDSNDKQHGLKPSVKREFEVTMLEMKDLFPRKKGSRKVNIQFHRLDPKWESTLVYGGGDAIWTYNLYQELKKYGAEQRNIYKMEKTLVATVRWMERNRVLIDVDYMKELEQEAIELSAEIKDRIYKIAAEVSGTEESELRSVYNISAPPQLGRMLREVFEIPDLELTPKSGQVKTDDSTIKSLIETHGDRYPVLNEIGGFRELDKAHGTYHVPLINNVDEHNEARFLVNPWRVATGRFAGNKGNPGINGSIGINYQAVTRPSRAYGGAPRAVAGIRHGIVAHDGYVLCAIDQAGVELRGAAIEAHEPVWIKEFSRYEITCFKCGDEEAAVEGQDVSLSVLKKSSGPYTWEVNLDPEMYIQVRDNGTVCPRCGSSYPFVRLTDNLADLHTLTAKNVYGDEIEEEPDFKEMRGRAKGANFAIIYGGGGGAVARSTGVSMAEGGRIKAKMLGALPRLRAWISNQKQKGRTEKKVETRMGRIRRLNDIDHPNSFIRSKLERDTVNHPVQGFATGDATRLAMIKCHAEIRKRGWEDLVKMILTVHDELVFEIALSIFQEAVPVLVSCMSDFVTTTFKCPIPFVCDVEFGTSWVPDFDWGKIVSGKKPVPEMMRGHVTLLPGMYFEGEDPSTEAKVPEKKEDPPSEDDPDPEPAEDSTQESPEAEAAPVEKKEEPPQEAPAPTSKKSSKIVIRLPKHLPKDFLNRVSSYVNLLKGTGEQELILLNCKGENLLQDLKGSVLVDPVKAEGLADWFFPEMME
jgi:DNA polymerase I-like protein with 3'-5' exonuclease and polymerase domains